MAVILFIVAFVAFSCDKEDEETVSDADIATLTDEAAASYLFNDVFAVAGNSGRTVDQSLTNQDKSTLADEGETCPVITVTPFNLTDWPKTVVIDFGEGCTAEEITRSGKIIITITDRFWRTGSEWTIGFENYVVLDHMLEGTKTVTFNGRNDDQNFNWDINVDNATITRPDGTTISWSAQRNREWITGEQTPFNPADDEYLIRGSSSGINAEGIPYTVTISEPLNILLSCPWVRSGVLLIEVEDRPVVEVDFGEGECDNVVTVTVNGHSKEIELG
ncbi:MAG: hypothetical protein EA408_01235 [Marinilabiliales bacterium]|nr:MAG: hypothetical protein EA408_01235 [Marinilabiliales bacterium]